MGVKKIDGVDHELFAGEYVVTHEQLRINALEGEVANLKQEIKVLNDKIESLGTQFGKWAITHI